MVCSDKVLRNRILTDRFSPIGQDGPVAKAVWAKAHANLALVKYWGKRDEEHNLPAVGSISLTLAPLATEVRVTQSQCDQILVNGSPVPQPAKKKLVRFLDFARSIAGTEVRLSVEVHTNFPVAAGLASSASTFAALAAALNKFLGLGLDPTRLSAVARRGSGSAARSIFGGFVEWIAGERPDGEDSVAVPIAPSDHWRLSVVIAVTNSQPKRVSSSDGMRLTQHSLFFTAWQKEQEADLTLARQAILRRDFHGLGEIAEHSALKMHALMMAARPALLYWEPATVAVLQRVQDLRRSGVAAYCSIDAGPQVKVLCQPPDQERVIVALSEIGSLSVLVAEPGPGVQVREVCP